MVAQAVAGDGAVAHGLFHDFHSHPATGQGADDGFSGKEDGDALGVVDIHPPLGEEEGEFRADESSNQASEVNEGEAGVVFRDADPIDRADEDADYEEGGVEWAAHF